jgi:hypothetical protein
LGLFVKSVVVIVIIAIVVVVDWVYSVQSSQPDGLTNVQRVRRTEGEDRSLSGSTRRGFAECTFGRDRTAMRHATVLIVCTFEFLLPPFLLL